jgi:hypothetical protein
MNKMVRKQFFITAEQNRKLKVRAAATGVAVAELVRAGIDRELADKTAEDAQGEWKDAWRQAFGMWKGRDDLDEFYANRRKRRRKRREKTQKLMRG